MHFRIQKSCISTPIQNFPNPTSRNWHLHSNLQTYSRRKFSYFFIFTFAHGHIPRKLILLDISTSSFSYLLKKTTSYTYSHLLRVIYSWKPSSASAGYSFFELDQQPISTSMSAMKSNPLPLDSEQQPFDILITNNYRTSYHLKSTCLKQFVHRWKWRLVVWRKATTVDIMFNPYGHRLSIPSIRNDFTLGHTKHRYTYERTVIENLYIPI